LPVRNGPPQQAPSRTSAEQLGGVRSRFGQLILFGALAAVLLLVASLAIA
jgi:hypothetical protein